MKRIFSIVAVILVILLLLGWLGGTWVIGNAIEAEIEQADTEQVVFAVTDYRKGFFSSDARMSVGEVEDGGIPFRQTVSHGPLVFAGGAPKVCATHVVTKLDLEEQSDEVRELIAGMFGEGVDPVVANTTVSFSGDQTTTVTIAAADIKSDNAEMRFDGAEIVWRAAEDLSSFRLVGDCPPISLQGVSSDEEGKIYDYTFRTDGFEIDAAYDAGNVLTSASRLGKIRAFLTSEDEPPMKFQIEGIAFDSDLKAKSETYDNVWLGESSVRVSGINFSSDWGDGLGVAGFDVGELRAGSDIVDNNDGTISVEGGYDLSGFGADVADDDPMASLFQYLESGAKLSVAMDKVPYDMVQAYGKAQADQYRYLLAMVGMSSDDPEKALQLQKEMSVKSLEMFIDSLEHIKGGMGLSYQIVMAPGEEETSVGLELEYNHSGPLTSLKTAGELLKALDVSINGKVPAVAVEIFPALAEMLDPQVEAGAVIKDEAGNYRVEASLKEAQLLVNGEPSPMQMMVEMFSGQELDWYAIKEGLTNPDSETGEEEEQ
ncbi:MAG: DUF945 family protein [Verrucomicrobiota bacterium]